MPMTLRGEVAAARERTSTSDEITYRRVFVVETTDKRIGPQAVAFCPGIPLMNYPYVTDSEIDLLARVVERTARPVDRSRTVWEVEVRYSSKHEDPEQQDQEQQDIESEPPEVTYDFAVRQIAVYGKVDLVDPYTGEPKEVNQFGGLTNSAGEPYNPQPEREKHYPVLTVTRNEINFNAPQAREYIDAVNQDTFLGGPPRTVKCAGISARKQYKKNVRYWRVTYTLEFDPDTWDLQLLDIGSYYVTVGGNEDGSNKRTYFKTNDQPPQPYLGLLDGEGFKLEEGQEPKFRRFRLRKEKPFAALNLEGAILF